jgi:hypothetical protein
MYCVLYIAFFSGEQIKAQENTEPVAGVRKRINANRTLTAESGNKKCFGKHVYMNMKSTFT